MADISPSLILLTYKGKALLMHKQKSVLDEERHPWSFISGVFNEKESLEKTLMRRVYAEMGIRIENVELVSDSCYHASLTDDNVNSIRRSEHQLLDFFTLKDLKKLFLSSDTYQFVQKHGSLIEKTRDFKVELQS